MGDRQQRSAFTTNAKKRKIAGGCPTGNSRLVEQAGPNLDLIQKETHPLTSLESPKLLPDDTSKLERVRAAPSADHNLKTLSNGCGPSGGSNSEETSATSSFTPSPTRDAGDDLLSPKPALQEESQGLLTYVVVTNDGTRESLILLTNLKIVIQHQLPKMPKEYITRLVLARNHYSMLLLRKDTNVCLGGVTFLPFVEKKFAEVVFLAIDSTKQTQGYGSRLMAHLKDYIRDKFNIDYLLTYADNLAIGYFKKQGFATDITLDKSVWAGCIKDYEEATILQCTFYPKVKYAQIRSIIKSQRNAIYKKIKEHVYPFEVYEGIKNFGQDGELDPFSIPGVRESGWTPKLDAPPTEPQDRASLLNKFLKKVIGELRANPNAWPFLEPVTGVPDYYDIIKEPMDFHTISYKIDDGEYSSFEAFECDVNLVFRNCCTYNDVSTSYVKCANRLEKWFKDKVADFKAEVASIISPQQYRATQAPP